MKSINGKKVSIIMPAFNEEERIIPSLEETIKTFEEFKCNYEIIVVDDGSKDNTYKKAKDFAQQYNSGRVIVKRNYSNYGKGRALKKGFRYAQGEYVIFLDADMDLHPAQIDTFFDIMLLTGTDVVIGSKRHPNSILIYPWYRQIMSSVYYWLIKIMFGLPINDTQTGLKLFKHKVLKEVLREFISRQFAFDLELLVNVHRLGFKIAEAPIYLNSQRAFNRIGMGTVSSMCLDTLAIYFRYVRNRLRSFTAGIKTKQNKRVSLK